MMRQESVLVSNDNQADKALLSVVRICIALHYDSFYLEDMSEGAKKRLKEKMSERPGPLVQMGFGLHAGKAVQGAIGSERKLDATYISTAVDLAEYLESSTKKYGVMVLMSGEFYGMLAKSSQRRCRKIDQVTLHRELVEDNIYDALDNEAQDCMELYTHDMVVEDCWARSSERTTPGNTVKASTTSSMTDHPVGAGSSHAHGSAGGDTPVTTPMSRSVASKTPGGLPTPSSGAPAHPSGSKKDGADSGGDDNGGGGSGGNNDSVVRPPASRHRRRWSVSFEANSPSNEGHGGPGGSGAEGSKDGSHRDNRSGLGDLVLPSGPVRYNSSIWLKDDLRRIRKKFTDGRFYGPFKMALDLYFMGEWKEARTHFERVAERFDDNPSEYFLKKMKATKYVPPMSFIGYSSA